MKSNTAIHLHKPIEIEINHDILMINQTLVPVGMTQIHYNLWSPAGPVLWEWNDYIKLRHRLAHLYVGPQPWKDIHVPAGSFRVQVCNAARTVDLLHDFFNDYVV